jgi:AsmA family protein
VLAGTAIYLFANSDYFRAQVENHASAIAGRRTKIAQVLIDWGSTTHVRLEDVEVSNTDWGKADHMLKAKLVEFDLRLWPLLSGTTVLPRLTLVDPELYLERNDQDELNWSTQQSPVAATLVKELKPEQRHEAPIIGHLEIHGGRVSYHDPKRKLELDGILQTAMGKAPGGGEQAELKLNGRLEGQPLTLHFTGGSVLMLREQDKPYPLDLEVSYGATRLKIAGDVQDPFQFKGANVRLSLEGQDLAEIYPLLGIPGPPTAPYHLSGRLDWEEGVWKVDNMRWHVGESDLAGSVAIDKRPKPSLLRANLVSQHMEFADLAPLIGATPGKRGNVSTQQKRTEARLESRGELFPATPLIDTSTSTCSAPCRFAGEAAIAAVSPASCRHQETTSVDYRLICACLLSVNIETLRAAGSEHAFIPAAIILPDATAIALR